MPVAAVHLFTDIEGSTRLWELAPERMRAALACHDQIAREAVQALQGRVIKTTGDGVHAVFAEPAQAVAATLRLLQALSDPQATAGQPLAVRCGIHAGADEARDNDFFGRDVNRAARIMSVAHGGQLLVSHQVALALDQAPPGLLPEGTRWRALGAVRLRDLPQAERLYQVHLPGLRDEFPALRGLADTPHNLPQPLNRFIGRTQALRELQALLQSHRLVTLWGAGGMGKSRLSIELAHGLLPQFLDGVWLVELAPLADPAAVPQAVAAVLGVQEAPGQDLAAALAAHVRSRQMLLILDNCEHVHGAAAALAKALLQAGAGLRVLASSRELLHVAGEQAYAVMALSVPTPTPSAGSAGSASSAEPLRRHGLQPAGAGLNAEPDPALPLGHALMRHEAVRLLVDRATLVRPGFQVDTANAAAVAEICRRLDGIPLAIELAAARLRAMTPQVMAQRLQDSFALVATQDTTVAPRQRTLRVLIDWSWALLRADEQCLLARLSVFAGGCTLDAVEAVCADDALPLDGLLDGLTQLVDKSLLVVDADAGRYSLLETVRAHAAGKLAEADRAALQLRHARWYTDWAEQVNALHDGAARPEVVAQFDLERANLLAAHAHALASAGPASAMAATLTGGDAASVALGLAFRQSVALRAYWLQRGLLSIGLQLLQRTLQLPTAELMDPRRARALFDLGHFCNFLGRHAEARDALQHSLAIVRARQESLREPAILQPLGVAHAGLGDTAAALACLQDAIRLASEHGRDDQRMSALVYLAQLHEAQGQWQQAQPLCAEALVLAQALGDVAAQSTILINLGMVALRLGDWGQALAHGRAALQGIDVAASAMHCLGMLDLATGLAAELGDWPRALGWHRAAQALCARTGMAREQGDAAFIARWQVGLAAEAEAQGQTQADSPAGGPRPAFNEAEVLPAVLGWLSQAHPARHLPAPEQEQEQPATRPITSC